MPNITDNILEMIESSAVDESDSGETNDYGTETVSEQSGNQSAQTYTREDEIRARNQALSQHRKQQIESTLNQSKGKTKEILGELRSQNEKQRQELEALKNQIQSLRSNVDMHNDKFTSDNIAEEERALYQDPVIKNYYDVDKVREGYFQKAKSEGRYVSPREEWAIQNAAKLAAELERYKAKEKMRQDFMATSLGGSSNQNMPLEDGLADVQDANQAYQWGLRKLKEML